MEQTSEVKRLAHSLGFTACGVARAESVGPSHADAFHRWIDEGRHADMQYMARHADKRLDPRLLLDGAQSIICVALNYYPPTRLADTQLQFAYYAYGLDYHDVVRQRLRLLCAELRLTPDVDAKLCCDTVPILDRYWAWQAGLGWLGKNKSLILPHAGSYYFLAEIVTTRVFDHYDQPLPDHCGTCHRCVDACPTTALKLNTSSSPASSSQQVSTSQQAESTSFDARLCLSYLTIENRSEIPAEAAAAMGNGIYGCDRCQQACPHNRFAQPTDIREFHPRADFLAMQTQDWRSLTRERYQELFRGCAVKRAHYEGLCRNIAAVQK